MAKDKFKQMQQGGGAISSFQDIVKQAATVANIEKQAESAVQQPSAVAGTSPATSAPSPAPAQTPAQEQRFMRLPNPQIPMAEYNLVSRYCEQFPNMTRQDFVELAIVEKLHADAGLSQEDFNRRYDEIRNRPTRGHRRNTKAK
jgi:hypothetical protein